MAKEINVKDFLNRGTVARAITLIDKQNSILEKQSDFDDALTKQLHSIRQNPTLVSPSWTLCIELLQKKLNFGKQLKNESILD
ncbi:FMN-binding protein [Brevibacillus laterosporus]|uniref:FMN-binding protein n=1 Tax=Brevibacillus laterosporus TaxID=1465 RepID=UPI001F0DC108|nr:FMN-binding protein [Brevibacillus laterosporus]WNX29778.1 FMN-binding protein [Brevibacillus laterosporus]